MKSTRAALRWSLVVAFLVVCVSTFGLQSAHRAATLTASKQAASLTGVACSSPTRCIAVGDYYSEPPMRHGTLVLRWNGTTWQREHAPVIAPPGITSVSVSCPTARRCVAVSASGAMVWNGKRWTSEPRVTGNAVSCPSAKFCAAVQTDGLGLSSEIWRDGRWTSAGMPLPTPPTPIEGITLSGVSCTSAGFCLAVGEYSYGVTTAQPSSGHRDLTLAERWNGYAWKLVHPADPAPLAALKAVSCRTPRFCVAVGTQRAQSILIERWTGAGWQVQSSPDLSGVGYSSLDAVACPTTHTCEAVGEHNGHLVAESWRTGRWSLQNVRAPRPSIGSLALSCASTSACVLAGTAGESPMSETLDEGRWIVRRTPDPLR